MCAMTLCNAMQISSGKREERDDVMKLKEQNNSLMVELKVARDHVSNMVSLMGGCHVHRDTLKTTVSEENSVSNGLLSTSDGCLFPNGVTLVAQFSEQTPSFDSFAEFAVDILQTKANRSDPHEYFVDMCQSKVAGLLKEKRIVLCNQFAVDIKKLDPSSLIPSIASLFWYSSQQSVMLRLIQNLSDSDVLLILKEAFPEAVWLHTELEACGVVSMTFPKLVRVLLTFFTICELSDPIAYLEPKPGVCLTLVDNFKELFLVDNKQVRLVRNLWLHLRL